MNPNDLEAFERYRRDRKRRHMEHAAPSRAFGQNAAVVEQLEKAEQREARNERLTREVHEFFSDATRTAAGIMARISEAEETAYEQRMGAEIGEFLSEVIRHAEAFLQRVRLAGPNAGAHELEPMMQNLVGRALDAFRSEGTANLEDKHIGQDPFRSELPESQPADAQPPAANQDGRPSPANAVQPRREPPKPVYSPQGGGGGGGAPARKRKGDEPRKPAAPPAKEPAAPVKPPAKSRPSSSPSHPAVPRAQEAAHPLLAKLANDPARMRQALELLVANGVLSPEEAARYGKS